MRDKHCSCDCCPLIPARRNPCEKEAAQVCGVVPGLSLLTVLSPNTALSCNEINATQNSKRTSRPLQTMFTRSIVVLCMSVLAQLTRGVVSQAAVA